MKKLVAIILAASFVSVAPTSYEPVQAANLFETLFPKTAERRKLRKQRERERRLREEQRNRVKAKPLVVKEKPKYYTYKPRKIVSVKLASLQKPFAKSENRFLVAQDIKRYEDQVAQLQVKNLPLESVARLTPPKTSSLRLTQFSQFLPDLKLMARADIATAVLKHYKKNPQFLWVDANGLLTDNAVAVEAVFADADAYGLMSEDYQMASGILSPDPAELLAYEFTMSARAIRYFADARHGLVDANRISVYHDFSRNRIRAQNLMAALSAAPDPAKLLIDAHPRDKSFTALKHELAKLSQVEKPTIKPVVIAAGTLVKPGGKSSEIPNIIEAAKRIASSDNLTKHALVFEEQANSVVFDPTIVALVKDIQKQLGLKADGIVGKNTIRRLNPRKDTNGSKRAKIKLAMERLRWHPDTLGNRHVFINQPAYRVALMKGGREAIAMNVVVGKKKNQTNFFQDEIEYVEFNPYWGIPRSILVKEMLPKLRANPSYFDNKGYEVTDVRGRSLSSSQVNWNNVGANFPFNVRQPPGPKNALGQLKIMFPNKHSIYMHDTPAKSLFSRRTRAFSHGCVRLQHPQAMAAAVLGTDIESVKRNIAQGENKQVRLSKKLPVYISYFTAWPTPSGKMKYYADIYNRDQALQKAVLAERALRAVHRGA